MTFSGDIFSGTTQGKIEYYGNGNGNFTITDGQIEFTLQIPQLDLIFRGNINDINNMDGTWEITNNGGSSVSSVKKLPSNGTWDLERQ